MSVNEKMTAIADAIRNKTGESEKLGLDAMVDGVNKVYDSGKQAEYDRFWDAFQKNGAAKNYHHAFSYGKFTKENYNPKYDIVASNGTTTSQYIFYDAGDIEDTKVAVTLTRNAQYAFGNCYNLKTIRKLTVSESTVLTNTFQNDNSLSNITIDGVIGQSINMQWCPLTVESMWSVISHLKKYLGTSNEGAYTITLSADCWERIEAWAEENYEEATHILPGYAVWVSVKDCVQYDMGWNIA